MAKNYILTLMNSSDNFFKQSNFKVFTVAIQINMLRSHSYIYGCALSEHTNLKNLSASQLKHQADFPSFAIVTEKSPSNYCPVSNESQITLCHMHHPFLHLFSWQDRMWRKNRRLNPGSTCYGTDLNRNFAFRWGSEFTSCSWSQLRLLWVKQTAIRTTKILKILLWSLAVFSGTDRTRKSICCAWTVHRSSVSCIKTKHRQHLTVQCRIVTGIISGVMRERCHLF